MASDEDTAEITYKGIFWTTAFACLFALVFFELVYPLYVKMLS